MHKIAIETEAAQVSAECARRCIAPAAREHVVVNLIGDEAWPMAALVEAGDSFEWLSGEPDLYTDADLAHRVG